MLSAQDTLRRPIELGARMYRRFVHFLALASTGLALWSTPAQAGTYDLDLTPLGRLQPAGDTVVIAQDNVAFRSLSSELGTIIAPQPVDPADSLGLSGFALSTDFTVNTISGDQEFWSLTRSGNRNRAAASMQIMGRKGLWPGLEVGAGATHVFDSRMWALTGYGKLAIHEGFHHLPIPSVAIRASFSRLLGAKDFNLTTVAPGLTISHLFGLGKTFSLTPYVGYEALVILSRSQVLNANPSCDEFADAFNEDPQACGFPTEGGDTINKPASEFVFENAGAIVRHRPHFGARIIFSVIRLGLEAMFVPGGRSAGLADGQTVTDGAAFQQQYTFSVGLDF